jgi:large subunit ribosomal protein L22
MSEDKSAIVNGTFVNASFKHAVEICKFVRGKKLNSAIGLLKNVEEEKIAVPMTRFKKTIPHKPGIGPGRYPVKASKAIRELLESASKNAEAKGLNQDKLIIKVLEANRALSARRSARFRRGKLTNIKIMVSEE